VNSTYNPTTDAAIKQLFNKISLDQPGFAYIASFDDGATYKGAVGLDSIEKKLPITTKRFLILLQYLNNSQHLQFYC